jgi:hypothetical protein
MTISRFARAARRAAAAAFFAVSALAAAVPATTPAQATEKKTTEKGIPEKTVSVPLTEVVLFTSGVGYFQHEGTVEGDARMELAFAADQVNDLLKSLVLRDLDGGSIRSVTYTSRDPLARTLRGFSVDLTRDPGLGGLLAQTRGEPVELVLEDTTRVSGSIIGVETRDEESPTRGRASGQFLNINTQSGVMSIHLAEIQTVRFLRSEIQEDLARALQVLSSSHGEEKKLLTLHFAGSGKRRVRIGYILETPVWKTSYRLVLGDGSHFLQGWAMVENTSDADLKDVRLTLVSGRPITFVMDLYEPLYLERPVVEMELYRSLRPRTYQMAMEDAGADLRRAEEEMLMESSAPETPAQEARMKSAAKASTADRAQTGPAQRDRETFDLSQGVVSAAAGAEVGSGFQYSIEKPVTLSRWQSALLPIVNQAVGGERLSIFSETAHPKHPLLGVKLKNSSPVHLMQGPLTVFDGGSYAGDAQIADMPPGSEQLLSFALDLDTEVEILPGKTPENLAAVKISRGILVASTRLQRERIYSIANRGTRNKTVLVEHPFQPEWTLVQPEKPLERSRGVYRFAIPVAAGKSAKLPVIETRMVDSSVAVTNLQDDRIEIFISSSAVNQTVKNALQKLLELKAQLGDTARRRALAEARAADITAEQGRIRSNMDRLSQSSDLYKKYVKTLSDQEEELAKLRDEIARLREQEAAQRKVIDAYISSIDVK